MTFESKEKLYKENGNLREVLEQHPLWFCFHNGKILKIFPQESETTWALNIKRGILSTLQTSLEAAPNSSMEEVDVLGKCPTNYQRKGPLLLKTKDLNLCSHRFSGFTSLRSVALPSAPQQLLSSKLECVQRFEEGILAESQCTESHLITPPVREGSGVTTQTQMSMKLFRREAGITARERVDSKAFYESSLLYEREKPARLLEEEENVAAAKILQKLCMKSRLDSESADLFMTLVFELRRLSAGALLSLWRGSPSMKCQGNWQPLEDALPSCATEACVILMKEMIISEEAEEEKIESFLWSLPFIPEPTAGMIDALAPVLQLPRGRQNALLGITALVHHFCSVRDGCDQEPAVRGIMKILKGHLGRKCTLHESDGIGQMELTLKAIGNAGLAAAHLVPILSSCATLKSNPLEIRLAAIEAFRRVPCAANHGALVRLYQTYNEDVEIRIASYLTAMKCPSEALFHQVQWTLQEEKSSQVGAFVWSHLSELLETDDPLKQHLKNSLPNDILSKEFVGETWKFSSYSDVTFHSAAASANVEARLIFSPASFIPRLMAMNWTVHLLGRAINLLEVGIRLENVEDVVQKLFGFHPGQGTKERYSKEEPPMEMGHKTPTNKPTVAKRNDPPYKESKPSLGKEKQRCPSGQYNKMSELEKKFTKRMGKKKPKCGLSVKVFGNELAVSDCRDLRSQVKRSYLNLAELVVKLLKGQEVQFNKRLSLATEELLFPVISGLPVLLALNASAAISAAIKGNMDFKQRSNFFLNGYIKPSAVFQISAQMGTVGALGGTGLNWSTGLRSSTSLDGGIQVKKGKEFNIFLNTPEESMEILYFSSQLNVMTADEMETVHSFPSHSKTRSCTNEDASKALGWQLCAEISNPGNKTGSFVFPFAGPVKAAITLRKQDRSLHQYLIKAAYHYISQKGSWIPNEAGLHFFMGTPKSELKRDIAIDFHFNIPQKKFRIEFVQPKKRMQMNGKIEASRNSRVGHLELILDDDNIYYIKGRADLHTVAAEQRYTTHLEAKLLNHGSPIVLSGNITKQPGKKMMFSVSLINLLKDSAFLVVCIEKRADDKLKQYSLEGETHVPGVLGSHIVALLQQRGNFWSSALRMKYGLFGDAKNLQHECTMGQKLKVENILQNAYRLDLEHELYCTQILAYNHKVHVHHEETVSRLHSQVEVNYGKHWDEINNKRRVIISQTFTNHSRPTLSSYFMEFTVQVPEMQVDYRTQLQHSCTTKSYTESSTNFKVHYNNRIPFVVGLQWKETSRQSLKSWEGMFNMDTPWLYLYAAHKLHQPQRSAYLATIELTTGKAFTIKGLAVEVFCKDKDNKKEGRILIHTPTTTYLHASTVNHLAKGFLHSQSEVVSMWNQLIKNEIHVENHEGTKFLLFRIKSAKQEFNMTMAYFHLEVPRKMNVTIQVLWTGHKNLPPLGLQFEMQIEEVKKEKMFYQKRGTVLFRHAFEVPIPQSFFLQETFTVNKKEKHYFLETKVLINGLEESVQTLTLGYQAENPHICAGLTHPYNSKIFPQNIEICAVTQNLTCAKCEIEVTLKVNRKDVFSFLGKYQNKSSTADSQHLVQMDMAHSFQLKFPQSIAMTGELFSRETEMADFGWGLTIKATIDQQDSSQFTAWLNGSKAGFGVYSQLFNLNQSNFPPSFQAHIATNRYGKNGLNGSFCLHSNGKDLVLLEADFNGEMRKDARSIRASALLRQAILTQFKYSWLQFMGKLSPSRVMLSSVIELNQNAFHLGVAGSKEQKVGLLLLNLHGSLQHNVLSLKHVIPPEVSLSGSLKHKNNIHEGIMHMVVNRSVFGVHVRNRNIFGNESFHNIAVAVTQNGSRAFPTEAKLRGQLELKRGIQRGSASIQMDTRVLCVNISNIILQEQIGATGMLVHNISGLYTAESSIMATYSHISTNHTVMLKLQGGHRRRTTPTGVEKLPTETLHAQFIANAHHNMPDLKKHGIPFRVESTCHYQNFNKKLTMGLTVQAGEEEFKVKLENRGTDSAAGFSLFFHHDMERLLHTLPSLVQVQCDGESTSHQLAGHCSGEVANHSLEAPARVWLNGSVLTSNCTADVVRELVSNVTFTPFHAHTACNPEHKVEISLRHVWPYLSSLGFAQESQINVATVKGDKYKGLLEVTLGKCTLTGNGELRTEGNAMAAEWKVILLNKCDIVEDLGVPITMDGSGHILINKTNLDSQVLFTAGENSLRGFLILKVLDTRQELHALLAHNIKGILHFGIPARTVVDLISEKKGGIRKRLLQFNADGKQITEELSFTQRPDHIALDYRLTHNLETLQALWIEDRIELQAAARLMDVKNLRLKIQYSSCWIIVGGQMQVDEARMNLTGNFNHKWPWLLGSHIPETIQMIMSFEMNTTQERRIQTMSGQTLITFIVNSLHVDQQHNTPCCCLHNVTAVITSRHPEAINLTFLLQKLQNKARVAFQGQYNNESMTVAVFTGFELYGPLELTAEVKHSLSHLRHLGFPFSLKLTLLEILSENKTEASLKLACDPNLNLFFVFRAKHKLQSEELHTKLLQNLPYLLQYFPSMAEVSSKVNYLTKEAEGKFSIQMENKDFLVLTKLAFSASNHTHILELMHTMPQFTVLPRRFVLTTAYQTSKRTRVLSWVALWDGKEVKLAGSYSGLFPKISGGHELKVEIGHPFLIPFPQCSMLSLLAEHSVRSHRDNIIVGWDTKEQVSVSSSLKLGKERVHYCIAVAHPFNFTMKHMEVRSLTESRRGTYNQQVWLAWNDGHPSHLKFTFGDKSKLNITLWDACVIASFGQVQNILSVVNLQACGSLEQTAALFNQHLDLKWDGKRFMQNLTYEKSKSLHLDKIQVEAILENVFLTSCSSQHILGKVETDYSAWLNYFMSLGVCGLPNAIALSGKHQLHKGDFILQSEGKLSLAGKVGSITVAFRNHSTPEMKNYSTEISLKASEAVWLAVTGGWTSSGGQCQILVEAKTDLKEKVKLAASKGKECLQYYMGYLKDNTEDGLELAACTDGRQHVALNAYLVGNGARREEVGRLALEASNQSLSIEAYGCGDPLIKTETKLNEITSNLQHRLVAKIKNLEGHLRDLRKSVQHIDSLYDTVGWPLKASQEVAGILQSKMRGAVQLWRQSGVKQVLQDSLPLYLGKLQVIIQQMQMELQKPLTTLNDAYYDVTLKPLDEVWQQRTDEYLKKLQALVPTVVKDVWLMEPIQVSLRTLKTGLDMVTQQMLSWAEAKFSRTVTKLLQPLSSLYSFSARNCSMAVRLPVKPKGEPTLGLASITNYLIEEKLMKPFRDLYSINPVAEYYRFKQTMMESPFEHHALLIGNKHLQTFDGKIYSLTSECSILLAKDFIHDAFTVILNLSKGSRRSLHVDMNGTAVVIYPEQKLYKKYNYSLLAENCQRFDIPLEEDEGLAIRRVSDLVEVSTTNGALFSCDLRYDLCSLTLDGWHHGVSAGLFGTNDNEAGNEWMLPDHSYADSVQEFMESWQVSNQCSPVKRTDKACLDASGPQICKTFFLDSDSLFRNCFRVVNPEPFYSLCTNDMCELQSVKPACSLAAAFVNLCNRNFVPLEMPLQCDGELRLKDSSLPKTIE
ncbi:uncharacterized protein LOC133372116 [Rhineura floridana]|uniref:uncharacterized protein LOC133372116 n=1 Tax=Rhineura floridana TaxID=261503 RepID=UPI002AC858E6|nr:uncharacterized protein LOC133372116 [Rhineura floridana]